MLGGTPALDSATSSRSSASSSIAYFAVLNLLYIVFTGLAWRSITRYLRDRSSTPAIDEALASPLTPPISILLPAYNEEAGDRRERPLAAAAALSGVRGRRRSTTAPRTATLERLHRGLRPGRGAARRCATTLAHAADPRHLRSRRGTASCCVIDKENGGKADALNAGVERRPLPVRLRRRRRRDHRARGRCCAWPSRSSTTPTWSSPPAASCGSPTAARSSDGARRPTSRLPRTALATLQVVEYFRAFLVGRVGWSQLQRAADHLRRLRPVPRARRSRRSAATDRHRSARTWSSSCACTATCASSGEPYRVAVRARPGVLDRGAGDAAVLSRQRRRWQRGLAETLWRHQKMHA